MGPDEGFEYDETKGFKEEKIAKKLQNRLSSIKKELIEGSSIVLRHRKESIERSLSKKKNEFREKEKIYQNEIQQNLVETLKNSFKNVSVIAENSEEEDNKDKKDKKKKKRKTNTEKREKIIKEFFNNERYKILIDKLNLNEKQIKTLLPEQYFKYFFVLIINYSLGGDLINEFFDNKDYDKGFIEFVKKNILNGRLDIQLNIFLKNQEAKFIDEFFKYIISIEDKDGIEVELTEEFFSENLLFSPINVFLLLKPDNFVNKDNVEEINNFLNNNSRRSKEFNSINNFMMHYLYKENINKKKYLNQDDFVEKIINIIKEEKFDIEEVDKFILKYFSSLFEFNVDPNSRIIQNYSTIRNNLKRYLQYIKNDKDNNFLEKNQYYNLYEVVLKFFNAIMCLQNFKILNSREFFEVFFINQEKDIIHFLATIMFNINIKNRGIVADTALFRYYGYLDKCIDECIDENNNNDIFLFRIPISILQTKFLLVDNINLKINSQLSLLKNAETEEEKLILESKQKEYIMKKYNNNIKKITEREFFYLVKFFKELSNPKKN
jgi:hypothetical protein